MNIIEISTIVFFILSSALAVSLTNAYMKKNEKSYIYWSLGFWFFALSDLLEVFFAFGIGNTSLIIVQVYLFIIAFMVIPIAIGSLELVKSALARRLYVVYSIVTTLILGYYTFSASMNNMISDGMVAGMIPMTVIISSSLITIPATLVIIAIAGMSLVRSRKPKMLWIIAGMLTFAFGGTLYIASFPAAIYYVEFFGLVMLWLGFFDFRVLRKTTLVKK